MRRIVAFSLASLVYLTAGAGVWWLSRNDERVAEALESTTVTLVAPEESSEAAQQQVNSEASEASREAPEPLPDPKPEPEPEKTPPEPQTPETIPPDPREMEEVMPEDLDDPEPPDPIEKPILDPADPVDARKFLALKHCPPTPSPKAHPQKRSKKRSHSKAKKRRSSRAHRASAQSRARRGGARNVNRLLARIKRRIARNKSYPSTARRRRMQGSVRVSFTITRRGTVRGISCQGLAPFCASARSAVRRAFPVDVSGASMGLPRRMSVTLRYRLR